MVSSHISPPSCWPSSCQGLTLVHCSAQSEPFMSLTDGRHPAYPTKSAYVELKSGRVQAPASSSMDRRMYSARAKRSHSVSVGSSRSCRIRNGSRVSNQGLTLVHFSAQLKRLLWDTLGTLSRYMGHNSPQTGHKSGALTKTT